MKTVFTANSESDLLNIATDILDLIDQPRVILFFGKMGVGKTTFIKSLCQVLGVEETISSPTFSLVNEYLSKTKKTIYHFDFYRIDIPEEALDMGVEEYFYSDNFCFVEWPEKINEYLPEEAVKIYVTEENGIRKFEVIL